MTVPPFETPDSRGRILILEHASLLREMHQLLLRSVGYETVAFDEAPHACAELDVHCCDGVIVDGTRREFVSSDVIAGLRRTCPNLPILAVLWHSGPHPASELINRGISSAVEGPVNPHTLIAAVDRALGYNLPPAASHLAMAPSSRPPIGDAGTSASASLRVDASDGRMGRAGQDALGLSSLSAAAATAGADIRVSISY